MAAQAPQGDAPLLNDQQFREAFLEFQKTDDKLRDISAKMKPFRKKHRALKERMAEYLKRTQRKGVYFNDRAEQLSLDTKERKVKLDEDATRQRILRAVNGDEGAASKVFSYLYENPETETYEALTRKKTAFGRADSHYEASDIQRVDPAELADAREIAKYSKAKQAYQDMDDAVRSNAWFEV